MTEKGVNFFFPDGERSGRACVHGPVLGVGPDSGMGYGGFRRGDDGLGPFIYREAHHGLEISVGLRASSWALGGGGGGK